ncbi:MAG TPA: universal stress protein [Xanthomonadales bacterium]|nr:universal stress protein [Xanthomonadales bacterium]
MYRHILIPTDGSELAKKAIANAVALARDMGAKVTGLYAVPEYIPPVDAMVPVYQFPSKEEYERQAAIEAELVLKDVADACTAANVPFELTHGIDSHPYRLILAQAKARGCDLICMSSHGRRGLTAMILGSETQKVLTHGDLPVLVIR